jgi:SPP1 gp7 family putative phage head morphogenesis protein
MASFAGFQEDGQNITYKEISVKEKQIIREYKIALNDTRTSISSFYAKNLSGVKPENYYIEAIKFDRLDKLNKEIAEIYKIHTNNAGRYTSQSSSIAMANNYYRQQYAINWLDPYSFTILAKPLIRISVFSDESTLRAMKASVREFAQLLVSKSGKPLLRTLSDNRRSEITKINQTVNNGLLRGQSFKQISKDVTKKFNESANSAIRVVRTEGNRTLNSGQWTQWQEAKRKGVNGDRMLIATLDSRTRAQSAQMDGQIENENGMFVYPGGIEAPYPVSTGIAKFDVNDRERVITIIDGKTPAARTGRNPVTGKNETFEWKSFNQWAKDNNITKNKFGQMVV